MIYSAPTKGDKDESRTRAGGLGQCDSFAPGGAVRAVLRDGQRGGCQEQPPLQSRWGISRLVSRLQRAIGDFEHLVRPAGMEAGGEDASLAGEHDPIGRIPRDRAFHGLVLGNRTPCGGDGMPARWRATAALISGAARVVGRGILAFLNCKAANRPTILLSMVSGQQGFKGCKQLAAPPNMQP
jgi:hypothetical protein